MLQKVQTILSQLTIPGNYFADGNERSVTDMLTIGERNGNCSIRIDFSALQKVSVRVPGTSKIDPLVTYWLQYHVPTLLNDKFEHVNVRDGFRNADNEWVQYMTVWVNQTDARSGMVTDHNLLADMVWKRAEELGLDPEAIIMEKLSALRQTNPVAQREVLAEAIQQAELDAETEAITGDDATA